MKNLYLCADKQPEVARPISGKNKISFTYLFILIYRSGFRTFVCASHSHLNYNKK